MWCFDWQKIWTKELGWIYVPVADVEVRVAPGPWRIIRAIVDSGAVLTLFKRSFGDLLGLDVERGKPVDVQGSGRGKLKTYLHSVEIRIHTTAISLQTAFASTDTPPNLLGRQGLFDQLDIFFHHRRKQTCFHQGS